MMVRKVSPSQLRSMVRKAQQDYNRAVRKANRAIDDYNREVKRAVNNYNSEVRRYNSKVRQHNAKVHRNRQIINNQLRKMSTTVTVQSSYTLSSRTMQHYYEDVDNTYYEGVEITPEQESILDLVDQEQATSLVTENYIVNGIVPDELPEDMEIGNRLAAVSDDLNSRWKGAVFALSPNNPDATRHFCTSTREIFTQLLDMKAPDSDVLAFDPCCELTPERKTPTRKSKIAYLMRKKGLSESVIAFADADIGNINELFKTLNGGTHGPAGKYEYEKLLQVKKRVEQGIISVRRRRHRNAALCGLKVQAFIQMISRDKKGVTRMQVFNSIIRLKPLEESRRERFIRGNQEAFLYGATQEFGMRDDHFEEDGEIISRRTIEAFLDADGAEAYEVMVGDAPIGGAVLRTDGAGCGSLDLLFVSPRCHSCGIGAAVWSDIERLHPEVRVWKTMTPYFEKRNIHFYVNRCGFHIVEFFNEHHPEPHKSNRPASIQGNMEMLRFEKVVQHQCEEARE